MEERHEKEIARIKEELQREVTLVLIIYYFNFYIIPPNSNQFF